MPVQEPTAAALEHPPLPPMRLRIGVTGRLPDKLEAAHVGDVSAQIEQVLRKIADKSQRVCDKGRESLNLCVPELVMISALAPGPDQLAASAADRLQWRLEAVLPFAREDYASDMGDAGRGEYLRLLGAAKSVMELDGTRGGDAEKRAYEAAGLVMLANSDLIIAVWNGEAAAGTGGTADIIEAAVEDGIPVVLVDPAGRQDAKHEPKLIWTGFLELPPGRPRVEDLKREPIGRMYDVVEGLLLPPPASEERDKLRDYLAESQRRTVPYVAYLMLQWIFDGRRVRGSDLRHPEYIQATEKDWQHYLEGLPPLGALSDTIKQSLLPSYAFADRLAVAYAQLYRAAFTFNYLVASVAVTMALLGAFKHPILEKRVSVGFELGLICLIAWRFFRARSYKWQPRWLEYRRLAEELRHLRMLAPLAAGNRYPRPPLMARSRASWINWVLMVNARALPLPQARITKNYLGKLADAVHNHELWGKTGQIPYNKTTKRRLHNIEAGLHALGNACFVVTALVCLGYLILPENCQNNIVVKEWVTFLTALLPSLGAALNAIRVQGDFGQLSDRSERTLERLKRLATAIKQQVDPPLTLARLADTFEKTAEVMSSDLDEWQILSTAKRVSLPS